MPALEIDPLLPFDARALGRLVRDRCSCRGFLPDRIPRETIEAILTIAQGAASWCNSQPWQVIVTEAGETQRFRDALHAHATSRQNFRAFGAPHIMIVTTEADLGVYGAIDCGAYVAHVMLAAQALGVATIAQAALAGVAPFVREWFAIPPQRQIVCGIALGRADPNHPANSFRTSRAPLDEVVRYVGGDT